MDEISAEEQLSILAGKNNTDKLTYLSLELSDYSSQEDIDMSFLGKFANISTLRMYNNSSYISLKGLETALSGLSKLSDLSIRGNVSNYAQDIVSAVNKNVKSLELSNSAGNAYDFKVDFSSLSELTSLELTNIYNVSGIKVNSFATLMDALRNRMDFFASMGCSVSDHALEYVMYKPYTEEEIEAIFAKRFSGSAITTEEMNKFKTAFMVSVGKEYNKRNWVMQLHYGTIRDNNRFRYDQLGPDTGFDCINTYDCSAEMAQFLNALNATDELPKTIIYSLNPSVNAAIGTVIGCFQDSKAVGKIQQGSAWWFNDHKVGMTNQMTSLANLSLLGNFIGMLTDSRSFLSYTRHEYFRRIMCELIGGWVENGEYPADEKALKKIVEGISYNNAVRYFGFDL